ncbi:protein phloem protein 2-like a2 [Fagus crenata]
MDSERKDGHSNPHRKAEGSYIEDPNHQGSFKVPVNALNIIWGNDPRFWQVINLSEEETKLTGFKDGAVLLQVNWTEVTGKVSTNAFKMVAPASKYEIYYIVKFKVDAFGWHSVPIKFKVKINGKETVKSMILESYREKNDVWHEIPGGEFSVVTETTGNVAFGMFEVESDWWKGGMVLAGIKIKPKAQVIENERRP